MKKTLSSRKKKKQQPEKEKAAQGLTPCAAERIECISLFEQFVFHPEIVHVDITSRLLCREVEYRITVSHKMQTVIIHLQRVSYFCPVLAVEAVIEIRLVRCVFEIAVDPQIHFVFRYFDPFRFKFLFNVVVIVIPNRYDIFFPVLDFLRRHNRISLRRRQTPQHRPLSFLKRRA